jgi:hypothetical protein
MCKLFKTHKSILFLLTTLVVGVTVVSLVVNYNAVRVEASAGVISIEVGRNNYVPDQPPPPIVIPPKASTSLTDNGNGTFIYSQKWLCSYETLLFDTTDGDLTTKQYAPDGNGTGYYVRTKPATEAQFERVDLNYKLAGLKQVNIVPYAHAYYDEFLTAQGAVDLWTPASKYYMVDPPQLPSGDVIRRPSTGFVYWDTANVKNHPQPIKTEITTTTPPLEPIAVPPEHHSIALDVASNSGAKNNISSYSWSHTCTGTNLLLAVGDSHRTGTSDYAVTGITYNSVAMSYIRTDLINGRRSTIYYLIAPATGSNTVAVTYAYLNTTGVGGAVSYTGAKQSGQPDANNGATASTGDPSVSVTTVANNCWVFSCVSSVYALTCDNTQRWNVANGKAGSDTNGPKTPAGAKTMSWIHSTSGEWAISAASFAPYIAPATAALTGTATPTITEADVVAGGKTIIITLTGDTWVADGATFNAQRQNIINGIDSAQSEAHGWDVEVKGKEVVGAVARTSDTVVTITLTAEAAYNMTATETITVTVPATAVTLAAQIVATPTFTVTSVFAGDIANSPLTEILGTIQPNSTYYAYGSQPSNPVTENQCTFTLTNSGDTAKINVHGHNATEGIDWTLVDTLTDTNQFKVTVYASGTNPASGVVLITSDQQFIASLPAGDKKWDFKYETGDDYDNTGYFQDGLNKSFVITFTAVAP